MPIVVHGVASIRPEMLDASRDAATRMSKASRGEPGCNYYHFSIDLDDPTTLILAEEWESEEAFEKHLATQTFAEFSEVFARAIAGPPEFRRFNAEDAQPLFG
jgi:quinol monooxygenase YgiN